jgi:hypothetical protein
MLTVLLLLGLAGCVNIDFHERPEGRVLLQVRDESTGAAVDGAQVHVEGLNGPVARGTTNAAGNVGLTFRAPTVMLTSIPTIGPYWIVVRVETVGYKPLEILCSRTDFVETSGVRHLTRGVALRRTP